MAHNALEHYTDVFRDVLTKESETDLEDNTASVPGENPEQYPGITEAAEEKAPQRPTTAAYTQYIAGRQEMLNDLFDGMGSARVAAQADIKGILEHGAAGQFESRAPLLEEASADNLKEAQADFFEGLAG